MSEQPIRDKAFWMADGRERWANMSRADRLSNGHLVGVKADSVKCNDGKDHRWQPVSFVFESQLLDHDGRVLIRQPAINDARVYLVCLGCHGHTYVVTEWVGYYLGGPGDGSAGPDPVLSLFDEPDDDEPTPAVVPAGQHETEAQ